MPFIQVYNDPHSVSCVQGDSHMLTFSKRLIGIPKETLLGSHVYSSIADCDFQTDLTLASIFLLPTFLHFFLLWSTNLWAEQITSHYTALQVS